MLTLSRQAIQDTQAWEQAGIKLPAFSYEALREETRSHPRWVHVGPGNIFRGYIAALGQKIVEQRGMSGGITAVATFDHQIVDKIYEPYDDLALQVIMHADGRLDKTVIASIGETVRGQTGYEQDWKRLHEIFSDGELQMVSFTITEKGYHIKNMEGAYYPDVLHDLEHGASGEIPQNGMGMMAALLLVRYHAGAKPIAMVSMDNFSHNGDKLFDSICTFAKAWVEQGTAPQGFLEYISDRNRVSFPCSMIDKITPRPDVSVAKALNECGFGSTELVITDKNTYIAPFVNAEAPEYLVIEDCFPNGRPPLEDAGVYFVDRKTVDLVERMKVCTCLNPLHTAMSIFGCLLGYTSIAAEMKDPAIVALVRSIGYDEGMPVVADPEIFAPTDFLREVLEVRLPNPFIPDAPQRIATDTSQKLPIRFGETIKLYRQRAELDTASLKCIPLAIAAWCRYLMGLDDQGQVMQPSPDPLLEQLQGYLAGVTLGEPDSLGDHLKPILSSERIFGCDLYADSLGERVEQYMKRMLTGVGAVRKTLNEEVL